MRYNAEIKSHFERYSKDIFDVTLGLEALCLKEDFYIFVYEGSEAPYICKYQKFFDFLFFVLVEKVRPIRNKPCVFSVSVKAPSFTIEIEYYEYFAIVRNYREDLIRIGECMDECL